MYSDWDEIGKMAPIDIGTDIQDGDVIVLPPIKDYPADGPVKDPRDLEPKLPFRAWTYQGTVKDQVSGEPIPGATVAFFQGGAKIYQVIADSKGMFYVTIDEQPDTISITAAEFHPWSWPASEQQHNFELERKVGELPPVLVPGSGNNNNMLLLLLLGAVVISQTDGKKKVGKVDTSTVLTVGAGLALVVGFSTIKKLLESLGIFQSQDGKDYEDLLSDPGSFWNPGFWKAGPVGTLILTTGSCEWLYNEIYNSFSVWGDDENRIYAAFKQLKTQSQLSFFSDWVQSNKGTDLLRWLHGSNVGPVGDHLSVSEIAVITDYFKKLPKFKI